MQYRLRQSDFSNGCTAAWTTKKGAGRYDRRPIDSYRASELPSVPGLENEVSRLQRRAVLQGNREIGRKRATHVAFQDAIGIAQLARG